MQVCIKSKLCQLHYAYFYLKQTSVIFTVSQASPRKYWTLQIMAEIHQADAFPALEIQLKKFQRESQNSGFVTRNFLQESGRQKAERIILDSHCPGRISQQIPQPLHLNTCDLWNSRENVVMHLETERRRAGADSIVAIQETYPEISSAIWKNHENPFIQYAGINRSACLLFSTN